MSRREILLPWDSQPQEAVVIDWNNPITNGLLFAALNGFEAVTRQPTGFAQVGVVKSGLTERGAESYYRQDADVADVTIIGHLRITSNNGDYAGLTYGFYTSSLSNQDIGVGYGEVSTGGGDIYAVRRDNGSATTALETNVALPWEATVGISGAFGSGNAQYYKDGVAGAVVYRQGSGAFSTNSLKRHSKALSNSTGKESAWMYRWGRILNASEHASIAANPWQIFNRRIWVPVTAASGPPTLAAIAASNLTASGARLTVT